jgi:hypothetical protein
LLRFAPRALVAFMFDPADPLHPDLDGRVPVDSLNIAQIGYDAEAQELHIEFKEGRTHIYSGVPELSVQEFLDADSKGSYFNREIKPTTSAGRCSFPRRLSPEARRLAGELDRSLVDLVGLWQDLEDMLGMCSAQAVRAMPARRIYAEAHTIC